MRLDQITTRGGDDGTTALGDGRRLAKDDPLIQAIGAVDEANSILGCLRSLAAGAASERIAGLQHELFDLGADLCCPAGTPVGERVHRIGAAELARLDAWITEVNAGLEPLRSFVLPGGSPASAWWHLARTVVRRAERDVISAARRGDPPVNEACIRYLNRCSDLCFVLARQANGDGRGDVLWIPARERS